MSNKLIIANSATAADNLISGTFSGTLNSRDVTLNSVCQVKATTQSTSTTTGSLIVSGGMGVASNVFIGGTMSVAGGNIAKVTSKAFADTPYTALTTDSFILIDTSGGAFTLNLPTAVNNQNIYYIKDKTGNAGTNNITIDGNGTETIDGALTAVISTNYASVSIFSNGANWFIF